MKLSAILVWTLLGVSSVGLSQNLLVRGSVPLTPREDVAIVGTQAFAVGANSFTIVSFSNPASPSVVGQVSPGVGTLSAVAVRGDYAYCAGQSNGVVVIDIDNPASPVWVRNVQAAAPIRDVAVGDTFLAAATGLNVTLYGLSDPDQPHLLTAFGRAANRVVIEAPSHKIHCAGTTGAFVLTWTVNQGNVTLSEDDEYGSTEYTNVSLAYEYVNFAQGLQFTALHPNNYTLAGQYGAAGQIRGLASGSDFSLIGLATGGVEYLVQTGNTPQFSSSVQATGGVNALAVSQDDHWVLAATTAGVTVIENSPLDADDPLPVPNEFSLSAYPNPFNSSTTVTFAGALREAAELTVYDVLGREVLRRALASSVQLDFSKLSAGSYLVKVNSPEAEIAPLRLIYLP